MIPFLLLIHRGYRSFILINKWHFMKNEWCWILLKLVFHDFQGTFLWLSRFFVLLLNKSEIYGSRNSFYWKVCTNKIDTIIYDFLWLYCCLLSFAIFMIITIISILGIFMHLFTECAWCAERYKIKDNTYLW